MNFGVREVATSKATSAPGWAYVPDTGVNTSVTALQPSSRKRARGPVGNANDTTAKQDAKLLRELAALDRENAKDVSIPVPVRHRDNAGRVSVGKATPAVRKILQSQKTFANHLSDFEALSSTLPPPSTASSTPAAPVVRAPPSTVAVVASPHLTSKGTRSHKKKDPNAPAPTPLRKPSTLSQVSTPSTIKAESQDIAMPDGPLLSEGSCKIPVPHAGDIDPLLVSRIPSMPTQEEIEGSLAKPPLTYNEARGPWVHEDRMKPVRQFCMMCGYWGRVRCKGCGGRVCALECLQTHQVECFTRYGA